MSATNGGSNARTLTAIPLIALVAVAAFFLLRRPAEEPADFVFTNARVYTVEDEQPWAEAIAIRGDTIAFVGGSKEAEAFVGNDTKTIDVGGRLVLPGFVETHTHVVLGSVLLSGMQFGATDTPEVVAAKVKEHAEAHPDKTVIFGQGINFPEIPGAEERATRQLLDDAVPEGIPVILLSSDLHAAWANSAAFANAGIDENTRDPEPAGSYDRDESGRPSGYIRGGPAHLPIVVENGVLSEEAIASSLLPILESFSDVGFTTVFDSGAPIGMETGYGVMQKFDDEGVLPVRVSGTVISPYIDEPVERLKEYSAQYQSPRLRVKHLKLIGDGVLETYKAALSEPYHDRPEEHGDLTLGSQEAMDELLMDAASSGFDIQVHVIGDRAAHAALDSLEKIREKGLDTRFNLTHAQLVDDDDMPRFKELNALIQTTPLWFTPSQANLTRLGPDRYRKLYSFKTLIDDGVIVASGSDWPVGGLATDAIEPFSNVEAAVTRMYPRSMLIAWDVDPDKPPYNEPLPPESERWTVEDAIRSYTINGAHLLRMEDQIGSLKPGKFADLIVVDQDVFEADPTDIHETKVLLTMMNGKVFHDVEFGEE